MSQESRTGDVNRRDVLKTTGAVAGLGVPAFSFDVSATDNVGTATFVEATIVHRDAPEFPCGGSTIMSGTSPTSRRDS